MVKKVTEKDAQKKNIPESVLKQGVAADDKQKEIVDGVDPEAKAKAEAKAKKEAEAKAKAEKEAKAKEAKAKADAEADATAAQDEGAIGERSEVPAIEDWEHKYKVLEGKYRAEVPTLTAELNALKDKLDKQGQIIASLQDVTEAQKLANANLRQGPADKPATQQLNPEDFEGYGQEIVDLVNFSNKLAGRNAELEANPNQAGAADDTLSQRVDRIELTHQQKSEREFNSALDRQIPGWRNLNRDKAFMDWLQHPDKMSGIQRLELVRNAAGTFDTGRTVEIFSAYALEKGLTFEGQEERTQSSGIQDDTSGESTGLGTEAMPDRTVASTGEGQPREQYATKKQFDQAQKDYIAGRIEEEAFDEIANSYQTAVAKGQAKEE